MKYLKLLIWAVFFFIASCGTESSGNLRIGKWHAGMKVKDGRELPFTFEVKVEKGATHWKIENAEEEINIDEISFNGDSIFVQMPVYEGYIKGTFTDTSITGVFVKESLNRVLPFGANYGDEKRFRVRRPVEVDVSGSWETYFNPDSGDVYPAIGIFSQNGEVVTGTFRTTTGDYRYLEGVIDGDSLKLSTFDGAHAFLFEASVADSSMTGTFYSGNHSTEPFMARRNELFELPNEDSLTYLKEGYSRIDFSFPDPSGRMVSLRDPQFDGKVIIVQIMGTWCPNCLDETRYLVDFMKRKNHPDLKIVALSFEYARSEKEAFRGIERLKNRLDIPYPVLLAQFGTSDKKAANTRLPMLNHIISYPTTIFIDRQGRVRKVHTGFNGPATGEKYTAFKQEFEAFVATLLK